MSALSSKLRDMAGGKLGYWCQGCDMLHAVSVGEGPGPRWGWNGNVERPVFTPSVNTTWEQRSPEARARADDFKALHGRPPDFSEVPADKKHVCHTFVGCNGAQPGEVVFLADCTHALAGTVQPLPDLPEWLR